MVSKFDKFFYNRSRNDFIQAKILDRNNSQLTAKFVHHSN